MNFGFYFDLTCDCLEFHMNVEEFWILFVRHVNYRTKYFFVTEFYKVDDPLLAHKPSENAFLIF